MQFKISMKCVFYWGNMLSSIIRLKSSQVYLLSTRWARDKTRQDKTQSVDLELVESEIRSSRAPFKLLIPRLKLVRGCSPDGEIRDRFSI